MKVLRYCTVNDRPIKFVETPDGGEDVLAYDWKTGGFVIDRSYGPRAVDPDVDVYDMEKDEFEQYVEALKKQGHPAVR